MPAQTQPIVARQAATCAVFCVVAVCLTLLLHPSPPPFQAWRVGLPWLQQVAFALAFALFAAVSFFAFKWLGSRRQTLAAPASVGGFDLSGNKPIWIGLYAGVGEELLFRAALQPLLGMGWSSGLFALAHVRTATLAGRLRNRALYLGNVFVVSLGLALLYTHVGLLAAILAHASIDIGALYAIRSVSSSRLRPSRRNPRIS
ncbi:MAG TPA: CPBP family intramembrane glutamic endopeptidase [Burkholderiaceae bacterium]|nr:CPBP family intramembrane glutamic endopeptidase [Burkholderiaceae bacterium]